jgi:hypothetical protein
MTEASESERPRLSLGKRLAFAAVPLLLLVVLFEGALRHGGDALPHGSAFGLRPVLNFKLRPDLIVDGQPLNHRFRTHEFTHKPASVHRILSLARAPSAC